MSISNLAIARQILKKMYSHGIIGRHHKRWETIKNHSGIPKHLLKEAEKTMEVLVKEGYIIIKKQAVKAITLNKARLNEIESIIES